MNLEEFLAHAHRMNDDLEEPGFDRLYVRKGPYVIDGMYFSKVFTIASVRTRPKREGIFTKFFERLIEDYPELIILIENVHNKHFRAKLERMGLTRFDINFLWNWENKNISCVEFNKTITVYPVIMPRDRVAHASINRVSSDTSHH